MSDGMRKWGCLLHQRIETDVVILTTKCIVPAQVQMDVQWCGYGLSLAFLCACVCQTLCMPTQHSSVEHGSRI